MDHAYVPERRELGFTGNEPDLTSCCARKGQLHLEEVWMTVYRLKLQKPDNEETAEDYFARHLNRMN